MRHQCKRHTLSRPADQRKALLRTLATSLFAYGEIHITMPRAKALRPYAEKLISLGKKGDLHSRRQAAAFIYDQTIEGVVCSDCKTFKPSKDDVKKCECGGKATEKTILRKLFSEVAPNYTERNGGYIRILRMPPRRGDNSEMALIQLV
ncbi:MAG: 50S ribosomal protein L17 [Candidatus Melainabacteria bacterium GWA2_34_9]|nr:MAG: 50S ribosomal protein L17 [Candidatus Melainabacteria bacterium GWA2_34_9]